LLSEASKIGYLVLLSKIKKLPLCFEDLKYSDFVDKESLSINLPLLISHVKNKSHMHNLDAVATEADLRGLNNLVGARDVIRGCDIVDYLAFALKSTLGTLGSNCSADVSLALRMSFGTNDFQNTKLYAKISEWSVANGHPLMFG
jgi:hypothetical protein